MVNPTVYNIDRGALLLSAIGDFFCWFLVGLIVATIAIAILRARTSP